MGSSEGGASGMGTKISGILLLRNQLPDCGMNALHLLTTYPLCTSILKW